MSGWATDQRDQLIAAIRTPVPLSEWAAGQIADAVILSGVRPSDDLSALRAEVVALKDTYDVWVDAPDPRVCDRAKAGSEACRRVLDLIDKHAREGQ